MRLVKAEVDGRAVVVGKAVTAVVEAGRAAVTVLAAGSVVGTVAGIDVGTTEVRAAASAGIAAAEVTADTSGNALEAMDETSGMLMGSPNLTA